MSIMTLGECVAAEGGQFGTCASCEFKGYAACHCPEPGKRDLLGRVIPGAESPSCPPKPLSSGQSSESTSKATTGTTESSALARQEGGRHYKDLAIQPVEYIHRNSIGFCEGSAIKYLTRWRAKGGVEDLKKARHFIDLLIEMEAPK